MSREEGFTLVEALVAFAILAVVLISLYEAMGTGLRSFGAAAKVEEAVLIAQSQLDRIVALNHLPQQREGKIAGTEFECFPTAKGRRVRPQIHHDVPDCAFQAAYDFYLGRWCVLEMQAADSAPLNGGRHAVLREGAFEACSA